LKKLLFITWDADSPHYMQGLFLPIMIGLSKVGYKIELLHLSSIPKDFINSLKQKSESFNIQYTHVEIKRNPIGFIKSVAVGVQLVKDFKNENKDGILMPRSLITSLLIYIAGKGNLEIAFDADGMKVEERIDFAGWNKNGIKVKFFKKIEKWVISESKIVLVRSIKAKMFLLDKNPKLRHDKVFKVVNGVDPEIFKPIPATLRNDERAKMGVNENELLVLYAGTIAPQYCLNEMMFWFDCLSNFKSAKFIILTTQQRVVKESKWFDKLKDRIILKTVSSEEISLFLTCADVALAFRKATFSMQGVAPIKIGEYLLCGLPVIASLGIGDTEEELSQLKHSILVDESNEKELAASVDSFLARRTDGNGYPYQESIELGRINYSLEKSIESYMMALKDA
jgi:glycosyltransferase involved in cell wall biosynthesis